MKNEILFEEIGLSPELMRAVSDMNYTQATGIQAGAIPLLLQGFDVIGRSSTGTGKTAAFGIPAVECVDGNDKRVQVLVLSPTRELAMQIAGEMRKYAKYKPGVAVAAVYGGAPMDTQIRQLRTANIVIGTPGRVMDHMRRKTLKLDNLKTVVLDEADEMLNMGFYDDIQTILTQTPETRQTVLFSATMPPAILKITGEFLKEPQTVDIRTNQRTIATTEQYVYRVPQVRKMDALNLLLQYHAPKRSVVFCNTKSMVDELVGYLCEHGFKALGLHGDMKQTGRTQVMQQFRNGQANILVATDVAARGIDVDHVQAVFNFDLPQEFEYYIHRIGRTGRAGRDGMSHTLVSGFRQMSIVQELRRFINAEIKEIALPDANAILAKRRERLFARITEALSHDNTQDGEWAAALTQLADEQGTDMQGIACALARMLSAQGAKEIPSLRIPDNKTGRVGKRVVLNADIGRRSRIAPNFIVGAIVDATGLSPRAVGKIDIFDEKTLIEMGEQDAQFVLENMRDTKIKGQTVRFTLSTEQLRPAFPARDRERRFHDKPGFAQRRGKPRRRDGAERSHYRKDFES